MNRIPCVALFAASLLSFASLAANTQTRTQPIRKPAASAPAGLGQQIAAQGVNGAPCASCHGARGEGNAASGFPRLAGQSQEYLARQLDSYADGSRNNAVMAPIAKALNAEQRRAVAGYYAQLATPKTKASAKAATGRGATLASRGDEKVRVQACGNCHGPGGRGEPPAYPYLAGQHASYLGAAMAAWKDGSRANDPTGQMPAIAQQLSDADVKAVAQYYAALPPPPAAPELLGERPATAPAAAARGTTGSTPTTGTGSEQGAPTSGGTQGPGGGGAASGSGPSGSNTGNAR